MKNKEIPSPKTYNSKDQIHYIQFDPQPIEICEGYGLDHHKSSAVEYILRSGYKLDPGLETMKQAETKDMQKAMWYCQRWLEVYGEWPDKTQNKEANPSNN